MSYTNLLHAGHGLARLAQLNQTKAYLFWMDAKQNL